jgi:putative spermidine/putrescine transport system permease protein
VAVSPLVLPATGDAIRPARRPLRRRAFGLPAGLALPALFFLAAFFIMPLVGVIADSFEGGLTSYTRLLADAIYLRITLTTVLFSLATTAFALVLGYPTAYFLVRRSGKWAGLIIFMLITPLLTSIIMRTFGWRVIFARRGLLNTWLMDAGLIAHPLQFLDTPIAAIIGLVHYVIPFMVLSIASSLQSVNPKLEESAAILGAGPLTTFFRITFPLTLDGIGTGVILTFMLANGSFVTVMMLGGVHLQTLPVLIYQQFQTTRDFPFASAASNILLVIAVVCLYLQLRVFRRRGVK